MNHHEQRNRALKVDRIVSWLDSQAQVRGLDLNDHEAVAGLADRLRDVDPTYWVALAESMGERRISAETQRLVVAEYELRAVNLADRDDVALESVRGAA